YFTENEFRTMERMDEAYYLYRICNFNVETGEGQLFIFAGASFIKETFEFKARVYVLDEKPQRPPTTN
nr:hypothetical protein [Pyrinomonadaceae bacterium]